MHYLTPLLKFKPFIKVFLWSNTSEFGRNSSIFGRTDLRKGVSEAKFDVEAAGDVKNSKISRKSAENHEKLEFFQKNFRKFFFDVEKSKVANFLKRVFRKFRADRSQVRGANGRSKFEFLWSNTFEYVFFFLDMRSTVCLPEAMLMITKRSLNVFEHN